MGQSACDIIYDNVLIDSCQGPRKEISAPKKVLGRVKHIWRSSVVVVGAEALKLKELVELRSI